METVWFSVKKWMSGNTSSFTSSSRWRKVVKTGLLMKQQYYASGLYKRGLTRALFIFWLFFSNLLEINFRKLNGVELKEMKERLTCLVYCCSTSKYEKLASFDSLLLKDIIGFSNNCSFHFPSPE